MLVYSCMWQDDVFVTNTLRHKKCKCCHGTVSIGRDIDCFYERIKKDVAKTHTYRVRELFL